MTGLVAFTLFCQALGALIGAVAVVWGEFAYMRAMRDDHIDRAERAHLNAIAHGLRWGMSLLLIASLALVALAYVARAALQPALMPSYWTLMALAILVVYVSWALSRKRISFALGSAIAFAAWWFLVYITLGFVPSLSFGASAAFFVVATAIFYAILRYARFLLGVRP